GTGSPTVKESPGLVFRRTTEKQPLIALTAPDDIQRVDPGDYITIRWRDEDPDKVAQIRLAVSTSPDPSGGSGELVDILTGRNADPDGVQDSFAWQVPATLEPGTYYILGFIDHGGNTSVAPGRIIVIDPTQQ
ncbi:MAG: Ser-Thr-rich GPI-anchored membrane family protein, partial [Planctomycetota bacterium]